MKLERLTMILATLTIVLGLGHMLFATWIYRAWDDQALWFVGTGMAIILSAAANLVRTSAVEPRGRIVLIGINAMMAGYFVAAWTVLPVPQVIVGGLLFAGLGLCAWHRQGLAVH